MARQHLRLQERHQAQRRLFLQEGMSPLLLLSLLPGGQHRAARLVGQKHRAALASVEIAGAQLPAVDQRQGQSIDERRP